MLLVGFFEPIDGQVVVISMEIVPRDGSSSSRIWYLTANVLPFCSLSVGVIRVLVTPISLESRRGAAHSLQNLESSGFAVLHLGQIVAIHPLRWWV